MASKGASNRAAIYARISSDRTGAGLGVERQIEQCRELAKRLNLEVVEVFTDNDISAYSGKRRPGYEKLLEAIRCGDIDAVLCWHTDRLTRRMKDLSDYVEACQARKVITHTVQSGHLDLSTADGLLHASLGVVIAAHESQHKGERIRAQKRQAAMSGKFLGGPVPFGWRRGENGEMVLHELEAQMIRDGIQMVIEGRTLMSIVRHWADNGVRSAYVNSSKPGGKIMHSVQVKRILLRDRNAGLITFHGQVVATESPDLPPIVELEDFHEAKRILEQPRPARARDSKSLLSGLVFCWCGKRMDAFGRGKTDPSRPARRGYRCSHYRLTGSYERGHAYRERDSLDAFVRALIVGHLNNEEVQAATREQVRRMREIKSQAPSERAAMDKLHERKKALTEMFTNGTIDAAQLEVGTASIREQLKALEDKAHSAGASRRLAEVFAAEDPGEAFLRSPISVQREIIRELVEVVCHPARSEGQFNPKYLEVKWKGEAA